MPAGRNPAGGKRSTESKLEIVAEGPLEKARGAHEAGEFAEGLRRRQRYRGIPEVHIIKDVVAFDAGRDGVVFVNPEALHERYVGVEVARAAEGVAARIAEVAGGREREVGSEGVLRI